MPVAAPRICTLTLVGMLLSGQALLAQAPPSIAEYRTGILGGNPQGVALGPDGALWFAESSGNRIGRITPAGIVSEYPIPSPAGGPQSIVLGPDGALWFTESAAGKIGRVTTAGDITEFALPVPSCQPHGIVLGPDGALWFTESGSAKIGRITSAGAIGEYATPSPLSRPLGITLGPDSAVWFTEAGANRIGRISREGAITEYMVPTPVSDPWEIALGPDGALWFTESLAHKIGRITTTGTITEYRLLSEGGPLGITAGPDGALWFTEGTAHKIGRITNAGLIEEFAPPTPQSGPTDIAVGPDGALWFSESAGNSIGRIVLPLLKPSVTEYRAPTAVGGFAGIALGRDGALWLAGGSRNQIARIATSGAATEFPLPTSSEPMDIAAGSDGALRFTEKLGNKIGRIGASGDVLEYAVPTRGSAPFAIALGPDGALWFTESRGNKIGRIDSVGSIAEYRVPTPDSRPADIAPGSDGALWFTEEAGNKIGRIAATGEIIEYAVPTANSRPFGIGLGPDGAMWFTELAANKIGRITTAGVINEYIVPTADARPRSIALGPDGALWFTESAGNKIGRITAAGDIGEVALPATAGRPVAIAAGPDGALWFTESGPQIGRLALPAASLPTIRSEPSPNLLDIASIAAHRRESTLLKQLQTTLAGSATAADAAGSQIVVRVVPSVLNSGCGENQSGRLAHYGVNGVVAGDTVVVYAGGFNSPTNVATITDDSVAQTNQWKEISVSNGFPSNSAVCDDLGGCQSVWIAQNVTLNSNNQLNLTVTATPGNDFLGACVMSVAGLDPVNPVDVVATHDITSGQLHMVSPSITTNYPNELAVSLTSCRYTSQKSEPNGEYQFTFTDVGGCGAGILLLDNQVSGLQAQFLQDDAPGPYAATIVTFKGAGQSASSAALNIAITHSGSFIQGQQGAAYTVNVSNVAGAGSTTGAVTVTETAPSDLTLVSMSGAGWSCAANICTRSDALAGGASYPPITVVVIEICINNAIMVQEMSACAETER